MEPGPIVRRIFERFTGGAGLAAIASELNADGIPPPSANTARKKPCRGWGQSTVRAILQNERYLGHFIWNRRKHMRVPLRRHRRAVERPRSEWKHIDLPHLAIVSPDVWAQVQSRFASQARRGAGRPIGTASAGTVHLLSGIAKCGTCGANMAVVGGRKKTRSPSVTFGCATHARGGAAACPNATTISEKKLNEHILGAIRDTLLEPDLLQRITERFNERLLADGQGKPPRALLAARIRASQAAIDNLTSAVAQAGWSKALSERLAQEEALLATLQRQHAALADEAKTQTLRLGPAAIRHHLGGLVSAASTEPARVRDALKAHLPAGITLTPKEENPGRRYYLANGVFELAPVALKRQGLGKTVAGA